MFKKDKNYINTNFTGVYKIINEMENKVLGLAKRVENHEKQYKQEIENLDGRVRDRLERIQELEKEIKELKQENALLKENLETTFLLARGLKEVFDNLRFSMPTRERLEGAFDYGISKSIKSSLYKHDLIEEPDWGDD